MTDAPTQARAQSAQHIGRFYKAVDIAPAVGGWAVQLDGRTARTPDRAALVLPTRSLARLVADEWAAQGKHIVFATMPATRLAFTALDRAPGAHDALAEEVARYAGSDLLCYFAEAPPASWTARLRHGPPCSIGPRANLACVSSARPASFTVPSRRRRWPESATSPPRLIPSP